MQTIDVHHRLAVRVRGGQGLGHGLPRRLPRRHGLGLAAPGRVRAAGHGCVRARMCVCACVPIDPRRPAAAAADARGARGLRAPAGHALHRAPQLDRARRQEAERPTLGRGGGGAGGVPLADAEAPLLAEVMAYAGCAAPWASETAGAPAHASFAPSAPPCRRHGEAAKLHLKGGTVERAIEMFTDLRLWCGRWGLGAPHVRARTPSSSSSPRRARRNEARKFAEDSGRADANALMLKQARWMMGG